MLLERLAVIATLGALSACEGGTQLHVDYTPDFDHRPMQVSVVGAYQGGLLRSESWNDLAPTLADALGGTKCEAFYSKELDDKAPSLASAIDHYTQVNGVSDELLGKLAPAATSGTILLVTMGAHSEKAMVTDASPTGAPMPGRRGARPSRQTPTHAANRDVVESSFELGASFYSIEHRHLVAQMDMIYTGETIDDAVRLFALDLKKQFPKTTCATWKRDVPLDEAAIQAMADSDRQQQ